MSIDFKIGDYGHLFIIVSFISSIIAAFAYWKATVSGPLDQESARSWKNFARGAYFVHAASLFAVVFSLFYIIYNHRYEYYYAWDHSANSLPWYFMISCFWEGQEGSFLLWIFWHVLLGLVLIKVNRTWETSVMTVFCSVQVFLGSMILGVVLPWIELKIGSSPFMLFREAMPNIPIFKMDPNFIPKDGDGLNLLLQNYWMVIHPPTLFLGFALTLIPFSYAIAGLWQKKYKEWVRPALPWALFCAAILGTGILMGGYWAYETLNFGGYWNWDPVENAVYVPWLVLVAAIHTMISHRNSGTALKSAVILSITAFILIVYSTFLTRSGILGDASVHSFTDLGLSGQLLIYLLSFVALAIFMIAKSWKSMPSDIDEVSVYSREFWVFIGTMILCIAAFQVLFTTSIPVYNSLFKLFGLDLKMAPPTDLIDHYSDWQIWFSILIAILSGIGQFFWWNKMDKKQLWSSLSLPIIFTLLITSILIVLALIKGAGQIKPSYIILFTAAIFSIISNSIIFIGVVKNNYKLSGGAIAHIGVALMLLGVLFSAGYSRVVSINTTGNNIFSNAKAEDNKENILLNRNEAVQAGDYTYIYKGPRIEAEGYPAFINREEIFPLGDKEKVITRKDLIYKGKTYFKKGDTLHTNLENMFYEVKYITSDADTFTLYPRLQANKQMGNVASPDIKRFLDRDIYSHLSSIPVSEEERKWDPEKTVFMKTGDTAIVNQYFVVLDSVNLGTDYEGIKLAKDEMVIRSYFSILGVDKSYSLVSGILVDKKKGDVIDLIPDQCVDLGIAVALNGIRDESHQYSFIFYHTEKDYLILKAIEKPLINLLWIGTILLVIGIFMAVARRYNEFVKMRDKGQEV